MLFCDTDYFRPFINFNWFYKYLWSFQPAAPSSCHVSVSVWTLEGQKILWNWSTHSWLYFLRLFATLNAWRPLLHKTWGPSFTKQHAIFFGITHLLCSFFFTVLLSYMCHCCSCTTPLFSLPEKLVVLSIILIMRSQIFRCYGIGMLND